MHSVKLPGLSFETGLRFRLWNRDIDNDFLKKRKYCSIDFIDCTYLGHPWPSHTTSKQGSLVYEIKYGIGKDIFHGSVVIMACILIFFINLFLDTILPYRFWHLYYLLQPLYFLRFFVSLCVLFDKITAISNNAFKIY